MHKLPLLVTALHRAQSDDSACFRLNECIDMMMIFKKEFEILKNNVIFSVPYFIILLHWYLSGYLQTLHFELTMNVLFCSIVLHLTSNLSEGGGNVGKKRYNGDFGKTLPITGALVQCEISQMVDHLYLQSSSPPYDIS